MFRPRFTPKTVWTAGDGTCWEAVYSAPALRDDASQLRDKAD